MELIGSGDHEVEQDDAERRCRDLVHLDPKRLADCLALADALGAEASPPTLARSVPHSGGSSMGEPRVRLSYVDPDAVMLGALKLENELARSGLLPRPTIAVQEILRAVQSANAAMRQPSEGDDSCACACGVLASLLDSYRRALAELGR